MFGTRELLIAVVLTATGARSTFTTNAGAAPAIADAPPSADAIVDIGSCPAMIRATLSSTSSDKAIPTKATSRGMEDPIYGPRDSGGMAGAPKVDRENPDPAQRTKPLQELTMLDRLRIDGNQWVDGRLYIVDAGRWFKCSVRLGATGTLRVRGYVGISLLGRSVTWYRVAAPPKPGERSRRQGTGSSKDPNRDVD